MTLRKPRLKSIRKLQRTGRAAETYAVSLPKEFITELGWQKKQKVVVTKWGKSLIIKDSN